MLKSIAFDNFRGFRSFEAAIRPVTALLGPNSSGKTTVLHAIRFGCDALRLAVQSDQHARLRAAKNRGHEVVVADGLLVDYAQLLALSDWRALFTDQKVGEGIALKVELGFDDGDPLQSIAVRLVCARNDQLKLSVTVRSRRAVETVKGLAAKSKFVKDRLAEFLRQHAPVAVFVPPFYGAVRLEEYRTRAMVDRMLGAGDQSHVVRNLVVGLDATQLERLNGFLKDTIGAQVLSRTPTDEVQDATHLAVTFRDDNGEIELSAAGAGLVNLIALYTALSRWRRESGDRAVLFLLDEPEAHLHPRLQADMSERLAQLVTDEFRAQIVLATHSVDILNRLSTSGALLVRCDRRAQPSAVTLDGDAALFDDLATWVDLAPYTAINFLASRSIVFCEGDDEVALLPKLAALKFRGDPTRNEVFRRWALVRLHGASNKPMSDLLVRLVKSDAVRTRAKTGLFRIELVLDRDHERAPGRVENKTNGVEEATTIWSQHSLESLLLDPRVLATWIGAYGGDACPPNLPELITQAVESANADPELNDAAEAQLIAKLMKGEMLDERGRSLGGEQKTVSAVREAKRLVAAEPAVWQRGKDRGRFVLGQIRHQLPPKLRNQFPTDVVRLVEKTNSDRIGDPSAAIPTDVHEFLRHLVRT